MGGWSIYISSSSSSSSSKQQAQRLCTMNIARICTSLKKPSCKQEEEEQARDKGVGEPGIYEMDI